MKISLGADHGGYSLKKILRPYLEKQGHEIIDVGTDSEDAVDYPDYAEKVSQAVLSGEAERGIMICGSGVGAVVAANKIPGIRAGLSHDTFSAHQGVEDDDVNLLCLGARVIGSQLAFEVVDVWLKARFSGAERHVRRKEKVLALEKRYANITRDS
jgi:ribose 5-phosphate isomerase B